MDGSNRETRQDTSRQQILERARQVGNALAESGGKNANLETLYQLNEEFRSITDEVVRDLMETAPKLTEKLVDVDTILHTARLWIKGIVRFSQSSPKPKASTHSSIIGRILGFWCARSLAEFRRESEKDFKGKAAESGKIYLGISFSVAKGINNISGARKVPSRLSSQTIGAAAYGIPLKGPGTTKVISPEVSSFLGALTGTIIDRKSEKTRKQQVWVVKPFRARIQVVAFPHRKKTPPTVAEVLSYANARYPVKERDIRFSQVYGQIEGSIPKESRHTRVDYLVGNVSPTVLNQIIATSVQHSRPIPHSRTPAITFHSGRVRR